MANPSYHWSLTLKRIGRNHKNIIYIYIKKKKKKTGVRSHLSKKYFPRDLQLQPIASSTLDNSMQVFTHKQEAKLANGPVAQPKRSCSSLPLI
jgi:hypothetical protein